MYDLPRVSDRETVCIYMDVRRFLSGCCRTAAVVTETVFMATLTMATAYMVTCTMTTVSMAIVAVERASIATATNHAGGNVTASAIAYNWQSDALTQHLSNK